MLENYKELPNGVIKQSVINKRKYDTEYIEKSYNTYGELGVRMSYLRYGFIIGSIGHIPNSILDVGYGNGDFLSVCKNTINKCYGYDISGYKLPEGCLLSESIEIEVDVVTFFDSLEHFEDISFVKKLKTKYVVISVPWCHNFSDEWFSKWKHLRPNEHLFHFSEKSLINFMNENEYELINYNNIEDIIRKNTNNDKNILTAVFKKK